MYEQNKMPGIAKVRPDFPPLPDSHISFPGYVIVYMGLPLLKHIFLYDVAFFILLAISLMELTLQSHRKVLNC